MTWAGAPSAALYTPPTAAASVSSILPTTGGYPVQDAAGSHGNSGWESVGGVYGGSGGGGGPVGSPIDSG